MNDVFNLQQKCKQQLMQSDLLKGKLQNYKKSVYNWLELDLTRLHWNKVINTLKKNTPLNYILEIHGFYKLDFYECLSKSFENVPAFDKFVEICTNIANDQIDFDDNIFIDVNVGVVKKLFFEKSIFNFADNQLCWILCGFIVENRDDVFYLPDILFDFSNQNKNCLATIFVETENNLEFGNKTREHIEQALKLHYGDDDF